MAACCAFGCKSKATKELVRVFRFPSGRRHGNDERRKKWIQNVNRKNWTPNKSSYVCELHFDDEQWEPKRLGKRKLRWNAVPTLFLTGDKSQGHIHKPSQLRVSTKTNSDSVVLDLREIHKTNDDVSNIMNDTADELKRLQQENTSLKAELTLVKDKYNLASTELEMTKTRLEKLEDLAIKLLPQELQTLLPN